MIFILTVLLLPLLFTITTTSTITTSTITRNGENIVIRILEESKSTPDERMCVRINDYVDISFVVYYKVKDSNDVIEIDRNSNFRFHVGSSSKSVIEGLDIGIIGTCINEKRQIEVPPSLGYSHHDKIPIGSTLIFNIYCNDINSIKKNVVVRPVDDFFASLDTNSNGLIEIDEFVKGMGRSFSTIDDHIVMLNFQRADSNSDGSITNFEFKRAANLIKLANEVHAAKQSTMIKDL